MTKTTLITQSNTKRLCAAAIADAKERHDWSNRDAGDALGCGEGTIRNRINTDDVGNQMTVHELRRSLAADGTHIANRILSGDGYLVMPVDTAEPADAFAIAASGARCTAELIEAAQDGFVFDEAISLLPKVVEQREGLARLEALLRRTIAEGPKR
jgi:hypothetical protein